MNPEFKQQRYGARDPLMMCVESKCRVGNYKRTGVKIAARGIK